MIALQKLHAVPGPLGGVDCGRKKRRTPADPSVRNVFPVARGLLLSPLRTRRDAYPPGSGGPFLSLSSSLSLLFVSPLMWRGCG